MVDQAPPTLPYMDDTYATGSATATDWFGYIDYDYWYKPERQSRTNVTLAILSHNFIIAGQSCSVQL